MTTKPNAFTTKPDLSGFFKKSKAAESGRANGIKISAQNTPPFKPRTPGVKREVRTEA